MTIRPLLVLLTLVTVSAVVGPSPDLAAQRPTRSQKPHPGRGHTPWVPPPISPDWTLFYSSGVTLQTNAEGLTWFVFPGATGSVNYLTKAWPGIAGGSLTLALRVTADDTARFVSVETPAPGCTQPPTARLYIERNTTWESDMDRWWSRDGGLMLRVADMSVTVPLDPSAWSNVWGRYGTFDAAHLAGFTSAYQGGGRIGMTFGAGCTYGHGVRVLDGTATLTIVAVG